MGVKKMSRERGLGNVRKGREHDQLGEGGDQKRLSG